MLNSIQNGINQFKNGGLAMYSPFEFLEDIGSQFCQRQVKQSALLDKVLRLFLNEPVSNRHQN